MERVATMAALVAREMHTQSTRKKHGGYLIKEKSETNRSPTWNWPKGS